MYGKLRVADTNLDKEMNQDLDMGPVFRSKWKEDVLILHFRLYLHLAWEVAVDTVMQEAGQSKPYANRIPQPYADLILGEKPKNYPWKKAEPKKFVLYYLDDFLKCFLENNRLAGGDSIKGIATSFSYDKGLTMYIKFE